MEAGKRKSISRNVVRGSVWESRMKMDEVKGGIKVFNGEDNQTKQGEEVLQPVEPQPQPQPQPKTSVVREKRKTWKQEPIEVAGRRKIRLEPNRMSNTRSVSLKHDVSDHEDEDEDEQEDDEEEEEVMEKKSIDVKQVVIVSEHKPKKIAKEEKKINPIYKKPLPLSSYSPNARKQSPPLKSHTVIDQEPKKAHSTPVAEESGKPPESQSKLQNIVDLLMWRDAARTAFVFGLGSFVLISSCYTDDLDLSLVSIISYTSLVYLAGIFIYKSLICSRNTNAESSIHLVGEEEAIWFLRLILPPLNEIILELKAIFSGDPATTMKLAVLLFVFARWGSFITIGKMVKLGFFGSFILPKICSSYSVQLTSYSQFLIKLFRDSWYCCAYKKVLTFVAFILVWNFSSTLTRIWAVFMLAVIVRYYQQQSSPSEEQSKTELDANPAMQGGRRLRQGVWENRVNPVKEKKLS